MIVDIPPTVCHTIVRMLHVEMLFVCSYIPDNGPLGANALIALIHEGDISISYLRLHLLPPQIQGYEPFGCHQT